jgi:3-oxoadipate enol-lactonase
MLAGTMAFMPTETRSVAVPGGSLHVVVDGDGPPILLVHAGIVDLRAWDPLVPFLVDAGYRVVRYDTRGFGQSTTDDVEFSNRDDLRAVLDDLGISRAAIVGNSRGAMIALDTILETPDRAVAFAWVGGGIGGFEGNPPTADEMAMYDRADELMAADDIKALADLEAQIWVDGIGQTPGRAPAWIRDAVRDMDLPLLKKDRVMGRPIPLEPAANKRLGDLHVPLLIVVGALDTTDTRASAVRLEDAVEGARRIVYSEVAHMVGMEAPERLAGDIVELVRPLGAWA